MDNRPLDKYGRLTKDEIIALLEKRLEEWKKATNCGDPEAFKLISFIDTNR